MLDLEARFSPKIIPASAEYPYGKLKPNTTPTNNDGTPVAADTGNDIEGFKQAAITRANIDPSGVPDNAVNSQLLDSLDKRYLKITYQPWTFMDGGVLTDCSQAVKHSNGEYYSWTGVFPEGGKIVAAGTDPTVDSLYVSRVTPIEHLHVVGAPSTDNTGTTYVQDLIFDTYGHVTGLVSTEIREGNTSQTGIVQLTDSTSSTSTTTAATPNSVKNAYDLASTAIPSAQKGAVGGVATLDGSGKVPTTQLPSASEIGAVPATRTVNSKPLSEDVIITASDVNAAPSSHVGSAGDAHGVATTSVAGFMSAADKIKLDSMGSGGDYTHPVSGVTPGVYKSVTVDVNGHVTSGTNPTTLAEYGITDAVLSSDVVTTATASKILKLDMNSKLPASITGDAEGNAATATKLATARTINGVSFDGSDNITINAVDSTSRIASSEKGVANGVAMLGADGKISSSQLPSYVDDVLEYTNLAAFPTTGEAGKIYVALDTNKTYRWSGSAYIYITSGAVDSVAGKAGVVTLVKADVGLSNVDNTSDINKPISTAQQSALDLKANLASPALTGTPSAPTATVGTSTTQIATTAFVNAEIASGATPSSHVGATGTAHGLATPSVAGFMSAADKTKLDGISGSGTGDQTITLTGDVTGSGTGSFATTLADSGVTAGTYSKVTVDAKGRVTSGASLADSDIPSLDWSKITSGKPTTLSGYGITDAVVNTTTINGKSLTTDITLTATDVGAIGATVATTTADGLMSSTDKTKLDGIATGANAYVHPTNDGNLHVPATGTTNNGKWLKAGSTAGSLQWATIYSHDVGLGNADNTSDLNKPISTATQAALDYKYSPSNKPTAADIGALAMFGTAVAASKLSVARTIAGKSFDGSADISITAADVGALASTGTAVAATKLATARTIAGKSFDGTANISITAADVGALSTSGGTLSGDLNTSAAIKLTNTSSMGLLNSFGRSIARGSSIAVNVFGNTSDAMYFDGNSLTAWQVRYNSTLYNIYHTGNKPTPAEIGAQPATSDSRVKSNIVSLPPVLDKIMLIDPKTFTMEGREGTCVGTIAQDWEVDFPEVILNVPSSSQGEPEMLKGIDALGTIGILLKAIQELKGEIEELKNR